LKEKSYKGKEEKVVQTHKICTHFYAQGIYLLVNCNKKEQVKRKYGMYNGKLKRVNYALALEQEGGKYTMDKGISISC